MKNKLIKIIGLSGLLISFGIWKLDVDPISFLINEPKQVAPATEQEQLNLEYDGKLQEVVLNNNQPSFSSEDLSLKKELGRLILN